VLGSVDISKKLPRLRDDFEDDTRRSGSMMRCLTTADSRASISVRRTDFTTNRLSVGVSTATGA
jgi:hypothetical protein